MPLKSPYRLKLIADRNQYKRFSILTARDSALAESQDHTCPVCGDSLYNGETIHRHHILEKSKGGTNTPSNLILVHLPCHYQVHHAPLALKKALTDELIKVKKERAKHRTSN